MTDIYFFGVWSPDRIGHFLYDRQGRQVRGAIDEFPCTNLPDGVFVNTNTDKLYSPRVWHTDGWTIYAMWDCSGDSRPQSSSTFLIRQPNLNAHQAWNLICMQYRSIAERIDNARMTAAK